jgi:hypothetical protein
LMPGAGMFVRTNPFFFYFMNIVGICIFSPNHLHLAGVREQQRLKSLLIDHDDADWVYPLLRPAAAPLPPVRWSSALWPPTRS